jgi:hypothetical protein
MAWVQKGIDIDGEAALDKSGWSVSMPDTNTVAVGAMGNGGNGVNSGQVRIYRWNGTTWVQNGNDIDGEAAGDSSGFSVSMPDPYTVSIGAPENDGMGSGAGNARVFSVLCTATSTTISDTACSTYTSPSGNYTWSVSGTYTDTILNNAGCDSIITIQLTILPPPVVLVSYTGPTSFCQGDSLVLSVSSTMSSWQWFRNGNAIPGQTSYTFAAKRRGNYYCSGTDSNGCNYTSNTIQIRIPCIPVDPAGQREPTYDLIISEELSIFPNPSKDYVAAVFYPDEKWELLNTLGKVMDQGIGSGKEEEIPISHLPSGLYMIRTTGRSGLFIKQ